MAIKVFNFRQGRPLVDVQLVVGRGDDFLLVDEEDFTIDSVDMLVPSLKKGLTPGDGDYPFDGPINGPSEGKDANGFFRKRAPKLLPDAKFANRVYMINWTGKIGTSGPHFKVFP
jgi:hypothetical protein